MPKRKNAGGSTRSTKRARLARRWVKAKRKARARARVTTVVRAPGPIPPRMIAKHKYVDERWSDGVTLDNRFRLNSTFAPAVSGGHQPYGRDTYAGLYNRYRVFAVRYKVFFSCNTTLAGVRGVVMWNNDATAETNYGLVSERPGSRTVAFNASQSKSISGHLTIARINGQTSNEYKGDDRFQALATASPSENIILHILLSDNQGNAISATNAGFRLEITYFTEWFDPLNLSQS